MHLMRFLYFYMMHNWSYLSVHVQQYTGFHMDTMSNNFVEENNNIQSREEDEEEEEGDKEEEKGKMNYAIKSRRSHFQTEQRQVPCWFHSKQIWASDFCIVQMNQPSREKKDQPGLHVSSTG